MVPIRDKFDRNRGIINRCQTGPLTPAPIAPSLEISQGRVSQLDGQFQEAGEAGLVVKTATGAPPQLTTEPRAQLPELLSTGAAYDGFPGEVWTRARVGEVIKPQFGVTDEVSSLGLRSFRTGCYTPTTKTTGLSSTSATCCRVAGEDFTRTKQNGRGREPKNLLCS
jgi:transposase